MYILLLINFFIPFNNFKIKPFKELPENHKKIRLKVWSKAILQFFTDFVLQHNYHKLSLPEKNFNIFVGEKNRQKQFTKQNHLHEKQVNLTFI